MALANVETYFRGDVLNFLESSKNPFNVDDLIELFDVSSDEFERFLLNESLYKDYSSFQSFIQINYYDNMDIFKKILENINGKYLVIIDGFIEYKIFKIKEDIER